MRVTSSRCYCMADLIKKIQQQFFVGNLDPLTESSLPLYWLLTGTSHASIFRVGTIVNTNRVSRAVINSLLGASAVDIVQNDWSSSLSKSSLAKSQCTYKLIIVWNVVISLSPPPPQYLSNLLIRIQVVCRPLEHQQHPRCHHTLCPTVHYCRTPHALHWLKILPQVWYLLGCRLLWGKHQSDGISLQQTCNKFDLRSWHLTPASSLWAQLCVPRGLAGQSNSLASVPAQRTLSRKIVPVPCPNPALVTATAPK